MDTDETVAGEHCDVEVEAIDLHLCHGKIFVWNAQDVKVLREVHHIVGSLIGSLPRAPRQNTQMGLPMQLMPEEANVLLEYGAARLVSVRTHKPNSSDAVKFEEARRKSFTKQKELWGTKQAKKKEELSHIIEVGRMSRKQRRAQKAMTKKLKQQAATAKLQGYQESVRLESGPPQTTQQAHQNLNETDKVVAFIPEAGSGRDGVNETTDSVKQMLEPSPDGKSQQHEAVDTNNRTNIPVNGRHRNECKIQMSCTEQMTQDSCGNEISSPSQEQGKSSEMVTSSKECEMSVDSHQEKEQSSAERTSQNQVGTSQKESEMFVKPQKMQSNTERSSQHQVGTSHKESEMFVEDEGDRTNKQGVRSDSNDQGCLIQLFTGTPNERIKTVEIPNWNFPETPHEAMRCRVFQNFWEQGYYLTSGSKFGGDFLAYPGDPFLYHSFYIVICLPYKKPISPMDIVAFGRMASNVKKTVVLCSIDESDEVVYTSVQWTGIS